MKRTPFIILIILLSAVACKQHPYEEMEERELASGVRYDTIPMGMYFGMEVQDFYDRCMELNRQKLVYQGAGSRTVEYILKEGVSSSMQVQFRPTFVNGKLYEMTYSYAYQAWAPWNKELGSHNLIKEVTSLVEDEFGDGFVAIEVSEKPTAYAKVDGNRRISISQADDVHVQVLYTDLTISKELDE